MKRSSFIRIKVLNYKCSGRSNMEYKLIAFDMDGTLSNSNKQISKKT